jgi:hypothetical protein
MKSIFFLLLLANVAFYAWEMRSEHSDDGVRHMALSLPDSTERIKLLSEVPATYAPLPVEPSFPVSVPAAPMKGGKHKALPQQPVPGIATAISASNRPAPSPACWLLGPYATELNAHIAQEEVARKVQRTALVNRSAGVADGYWLLYPRAENIEAGRDNRRMLLEKGIRDLWLFDRGELAGYISLGLYQTQAGVEQAQKKYFERNIATEIRPREAAVHAYWLEIPWQGGRNQLESVLGAIDKAGGAVSLHPC